MRKLNVFLALWFFIFSTCLTDPSVRWANARDAREDLTPAMDLIVMLEGELNSEIMYGAGIIFAVEKDALYIATANHNVRHGSHKASNMKIRLRTHPDIDFTGQLLDAFDPNKDLAVIRVEKLQEQGIAITQVNMNVLGKTGTLDRGDVVYPIGYRERRAWEIPTKPDRVARLTGNEIEFQSEFAGPGHSGGGLIKDNGVLVGMITFVYGPHGTAIDIEELGQTLTKWGYPLGLGQSKAYEIDGKWKVIGDSIFSSFTFKTEGDKLSGELEVGYPIQSSLTMEPGGHTSTSYSLESSAVLEGGVKVDRIEFNAKGSWEQKITEYREGRILPYVNRGEEVITFSVHLEGELVDKNIRLRFEFEYPLIREKSKGEFTIRRFRENKPKPSPPKIYNF